uniref:Uncharacterized protein n=1 Tax=Prevotella sp. GTC17254 TaxID=3236794 RepID=A0AB33IZS9_9BACT
MSNNNFTNQLRQYVQSKQDSESPQIQGFTDGYKQAVLDFKAILQEQEGKGYKSLKGQLWTKTNEDLVTIEAVKNYEDIQGVPNNKPEMFHVRFVYDPSGSHQIYFDKNLPFIPIVGQKFYWEDWNDLDSPFHIEEVQLAFKDDGCRNFDGIWCWCTD